VTSDELAEGVAALAGLLDLLPALRAVVLVGARAGRAAPLLERKGLALFKSATISGANALTHCVVDQRRPRRAVRPRRFLNVRGMCTVIVSPSDAVTLVSDRRR